MKEIKAFIRPIKIREVCKALRTNGFCCMTLIECEGTGMYTDKKKDFPTLKFPFIHSNVVKIEIICRDSDEEQIVKIIKKHGRTGRSGDGIIYTMGGKEVYKVKNAQTGAEAC